MAECPVGACAAVKGLEQTLRDTGKALENYHSKQDKSMALIEGIHRGMYGDPANPETSKGLIGTQKEQGRAIKELQTLVPEVQAFKKAKSWLYAVSVIIGGASIVGAFVFMLKLSHIINTTGLE